MTLARRSTGAKRTAAPQRRRLGETAELVRREVAPRARLQAAVLDRADPRPHQSRHRMADRLAHPADLAIAALVDRDPQHAGARLGHLGRGRGPSSSVTPSRRRRIAPAATGPPVDSGQVFLVEPVARVGDAVGQLAVVGEQQQALRVGVEAADGEHPRLGGDQLDDRGAAVRVAGRRDDAAWLVQQVVDEPGLGADRRTVDLDEVDLRVDAAAEHGHVAVDRHPAVGDQLLAHPPAAEAAPRRGPSAAVQAVFGHRSA